MNLDAVLYNLNVLMNHLFDAKEMTGVKRLTPVALGSPRRAVAVSSPLVMILADCKSDERPFKLTTTSSFSSERQAELDLELTLP